MQPSQWKKASSCRTGRRALAGPRAGDPHEAGSELLDCVPRNEALARDRVLLQGHPDSLLESTSVDQQADRSPGFVDALVGCVRPASRDRALSPTSRGGRPFPRGSPQSRGQRACGRVPDRRSNRRKAVATSRSRHRAPPAGPRSQHAASPGIPSAGRRRPAHSDDRSSPATGRRAGAARGSHVGWRRSSGPVVGREQQRQGNQRDECEQAQVEDAKHVGDPPVDVLTHVALVPSD